MGKKYFSLFLAAIFFIIILAGNIFQAQARIPLVDEINPRSSITPSGIPTISVQQLPPEAHQTLKLIKRGGPFPYQQDGTVFGNREKILPQFTRGYYREYTVPTPGSRNRGARRIVTGQQREFYYTQDHYRSFYRVKL